jgi:6-phosphogluconolactonase
MKLLVILLVIAFPAVTYSAQERFYVGTYTGPGKAEGIYTCVLDSDTGKLGPVSLAVKAHNPNYLALALDGRHLYAVTSDGGGSVEAFAIGAGGALAPLNSQLSGGAGACHLCAHPSGKYVLVANYGDGAVGSIPIQPDGSLAPAVSVLRLTGSGPNPARQAGPHAHCVHTDRSGLFTYACDLGTDKVWVNPFDPATGRFGKPVEPEAKVPPGSGARHLAFGPGEDFAYVNGEMGRNVTVFRRDPSTGALTALQTLPLVPGSGPATGIFSAEIACHPAGKWLYVSSRGDDIIALFAIGPDGRLEFVQDTPSIAKFPRAFAIDPAGRWLIAAGQNDSRLAVLRIAPDTGKLTALPETMTAPSPVCILFLP